MSKPNKDQYYADIKAMNYSSRNTNDIYNSVDACSNAKQMWNIIKRVRDAKYLKEQMLLALKDEAGANLDNEENDFMLDNAYEDNTLEELNATMIMMARIQPTDDKSNESQLMMMSSIFSQIDSVIIFDDPYVNNNSGQTEHDINAHDQSLHDFESFIINVQVEAEKQRTMNIELQKQKSLLQWELETCKERREIALYKQAIKERENKYPEDIAFLEEKLRSHDRIMFKMQHSLRTIYMLVKKPNKVYDPHLKTGLGYANPERLKKAIEAQLKMYDGENLTSTKLKVDLPDYEKTLEDAEESRLKMKDKMIQLDYANLNALYESFAPQTVIPFKQTYFSSPSTSNVSSESSSVKSDLPSKKMSDESKLLKLFVNLNNEIN
nr:hypothetical protein [Tanacetum cinerariifolium]